MRRVWHSWIVTGVMTVAWSEFAWADSLPKPVVKSIALLGWYQKDVPRIEIVSEKPRHIGDNVEAWVTFANGQPIPIIYLRIDTDVYRDAARGEYQALVRLAGILAHERWHLRYGRDEEGAYAAQISIMQHLQATTARIAQVRRALQRLKKGGTAGPNTSKLNQTGRRVMSHSKPSPVSPLETGGATWVLTP
jgi:hypothetical protein